jgi:peptidoglycan/xylan/chitin deacetylase (PgdA/CDA1 family)
VSDGTLEASSRAPLLDYFRIPYRLDDGAAIAPSLNRIVWRGSRSSARSLLWPAGPTVAPPARYGLGRFTVFAGVSRDHPTALQRAVGGSWSRVAALRDRQGEPAAWIQADDDGNVFLPFDPAQAMELLLTERYRSAGRSKALVRARTAAARAYYAGRRFLPRRAQIAFRRRLVSVQSRSTFPSWPLESSLHDLYDLVLGLLAHVAREPVPYLASWPAGRSWAFVLTHDVETHEGYEQLGRLREIELELGFRSAWNFVPARYEVDDDLVLDLWSEGHEVGVHGLYHDGRDLESRALLKRRLPAMRGAAERWRSSGFRAPALRRNLEVMPLLGFDYDSSYPDTDPYGPEGGGCCSWLPFEIDGVVELPVTLPQDHTLFEILGRVDGRDWHEKTEQLRRRNGMALLITHPDYMLDGVRLGEYRRFLAAFAQDESAWRALPNEVSGWWRRRMGSRLVRERDGWAVEGATGGEATINFVEPRELAECLQ